MKILCPICGGKNVFKYFEDDPFLEECQDCPIVFTHPLPSGLSEAYDEDYYRIWYEKQFKKRQKLWKRRLKLVKEFCASGRLLDVGTGDGLFLKSARKENFEVYGTEISTAAVRAAKNLYDLDIHLIEIEDARFEENSFDLVTLWHVIEHVKNPLRVLKKVHHLLKPRGLVFVATPNLDKHLTRTIYRMKHKRPYPFYSPKGEQHLFHFTGNTLGKMMEKAGFNIIRFRADFAFLSPKFRILEYASFFLSSLFRRNWYENILVIAQK